MVSLLFDSSLAFGVEVDVETLQCEQSGSVCFQNLPRVAR